MIAANLKKELESFKNGTKLMGVNLSAAQTEKNLNYLRLLLEANQEFNLTGITNPKEAITKHLLDSLSIHPLLTGKTVADIGSGGGTPGIPLAIAAPKKQFVLIEAKKKKATFLLETVRELGLKNVVVVNKRAEETTLNNAANTIVSRALGSLDYFLRVAGHLLPKGGLAVAMKGKAERFRLEEASTNFRVLQIKKINVPYLDADRHAVCILKRK